jgi:hypothetical protein
MASCADFRSAGSGPQSPLSHERHRGDEQLEAAQLPVLHVRNRRVPVGGGVAGRPRGLLRARGSAAPAGITRRRRLGKRGAGIVTCLRRGIIARLARPPGVSGPGGLVPQG